MAEVAAPHAFDAQDRIHLTVQALGQQRPVAEAPIPQQDVARLQLLPEDLQEAHFMLLPVARGPGGQHARRQTEQGDQADEGKAAARLWHGLLGKSGLVFRGVRGREGGAIDDQDVPSTPPVFDRHSRVGFTHEAVVNFLQSFPWQGAPGLAIGTGGVGGRAALGVRQGLGLADGFPAGGPGLGDLPEEGPEDQAQIPAAIARVSALVLLGQPPVGDPGGKERFELVQGGRAGAQATQVPGKAVGPEREVRCHIGQHIYCPIDRPTSLFSCQRPNCRKHCLWLSNACASGWRASGGWRWAAWWNATNPARAAHAINGRAASGAKR